ncbi:MAG: hypothetical protein ACI85N_000547 [Gammaproteobacteria bacterium]|jgi:hypothetical protein
MFKDEQYVARGHDCIAAGVRAKQEARAEESEAIMLTCSQITDCNTCRIQPDE